MRFLFSPVILMLMMCPVALAQIDTAFIYNENTLYGGLDIRLSRGLGHMYYLQHGKTYSFRENNGIPTGKFHKMTAWDSEPYTEGNMRESTGSGDKFVMNYRLLIPKGYDPERAQGYPLVVVMHGLHERGNCADNDCYFANRKYTPGENVPPAPKDGDHKLLNNDFQLVHAGLDYLEAHNVNGSLPPDDPSAPSGAYPGFVLFPQNLNGWDATASSDVIRLVRLLVRAYNVNADAVYVNGVSHGGHGAYEVLKRAPWMFAAGVMFSSADDASLISQKMVDEISTVPLWIFQGALDTNPSPAKTTQYISAFRKSGANVRYTLYPHLGHGTWNEALDEPDFFSWMLSKRRNNIHVQGEKASICATTGEGARLRLPQGYSSYQWEYNGNILDASSALLVARQPGEYRGRFMLSKQGNATVWSTWSAVIVVTEGAPPTPSIRQVGTLLLPDLNGKPDAILHAEEPFPQYHWYKNGEPIRSGGVTDTSRIFLVKSQMGNGAYSLRVSGYDGCKSPESAIMNILFNDTSPVNLAGPSEVKASVTSPSGVSLTWTDTSEGEAAFEVWRRSTRPDGITSRWTMAGLVNENATGFSDRGLMPGAEHHYKIRAVSDKGRSVYKPEQDSNAITVRTPEDKERPTAPTNLSASQAGVNAIRLNWSSSDDNSSINHYIIVYAADSLHTTSADTTFVVTGLDLNADYAFQVSAVDQSGNISAGSNNAFANTFLRGLYYQHSTGAWESIEMIDWSVAEFSGVVDDFTLEPKTQEDFFNFVFDGFLNIGHQGVYQFRVTSDDGSIFYLNDSILIENDGIHNISTVTSPVTVLENGPHRITLRYFDYVLADTLLVEFKGPDSGGEWSKIPSHALASSRITSNEPVFDRELNFSVYPNPVRNGNARIEFYSSLDVPVYIIIMNTSGRIVYETLTESPSQPYLTLPVLPDEGVYIISIQQGNFRVSKKIVSIR